MASVLIKRIFCRRFQLSKSFSTLHSESVLENESAHEEEKIPHIPVLVKEVIENLKLKEGDMFLDMTFGAGGHSEALLKEIPNLQVYALDRDPVAMEFAKKLQLKYPGQVKTLEGKFSDLPNLLKDYNIEQNSFDGILFDLGCSSMQFENSERGFSIVRDGPLDMRMDGGREKGLTAADVIAYGKEKDLAQIFKIYGGERLGVKIAQAIIQAREKFQPLKTTGQLKDLVETVLEREVRTDKLNRRVSPATKVFQALRIFVNNEINELNYGLLLANKYLKPNGRAVVISFHSGEDTIVKRQFKNYLVDNSVKPMPLVYFNTNKNYSLDELKDFQPKCWNHILKKTTSPNDEEVMINPRSRSAVLRVAEKIEESEVSSIEQEYLDES